MIDEQQLENYNTIKKSLMGIKEKALVIQITEAPKTASTFENINQYFIMCKNDQDKFIMIFALKKLGMVQGKLVINVTDVIQAYRIKFFFNRFHMKAFVLSPDLAKAQTQSIIHFFSIGQFDILIVLNEGYKEGESPVLKDLSFVINFDLPQQYARYKETACMVELPEGAVINLVAHKEQ